MSLFQQLGGLLQQYAGGGNSAGTAENDYQQVAANAPPGLLANGYATAFRSDQTPPFNQMVGQLFGQAQPHQQAGLLNTLLQAAGPQIAAQLLGGGGGPVTPEQASQISPGVVEQLANHAQNQDGSVVDKISGFLTQHPQLFQSLGPGVLSQVMGGMAGQTQGAAPASQDPYGDPGNAAPASQDPYGDPADQASGAAPASQDPYGDPADQR